MKVIPVLFVAVMLCSQEVNAQKVDDSKIIITVDSTENLYIRLKDIFIRRNFFVKDLSIRDSLITYPTEFKGVFVIGFAAIDGNKVTLSGLFGLKRLDEFGYTNSPKGFSSILYFKGNREWRILNEIATSLGGVITYEK